VTGAADVGGSASVDSTTAAGPGLSSPAHSPSTPDIEGAASSGTRVDVGGAATGATSGAAIGGAASTGIDSNVGIGGGADTDLGGGVSSVQPTASGSLDGSADVDVPDGKLMRDAEGDLRDQQSKGSGESVEAGVYDSVGPQGKSTVHGGAVGRGEGHIDTAMGDHDAAREGKAALNDEGFEQRREAEARLDAGASTRAQESDLGNAYQERVNQRDHAVGTVDSAQDAGDEAGRVARDPSGSAKVAVTDAGIGEARDRAPVNPEEANANVKVVSETMNDPAHAAEGHAELEVDAQVRGTDPTRKK
jgi:hypothetical protein